VTNYRAVGGAAHASEKDTAAFALTLLNIKKNAEAAGSATAATATAIATTATSWAKSFGTPAAGAGAAGGKSAAAPIEAQAAAFDALKPKIDANTESLKQYETLVSA